MHHSWLHKWNNTSADNAKDIDVGTINHFLQHEEQIETMKK